MMTMMMMMIMLMVVLLKKRQILQADTHATYNIKQKKKLWI